MNIKTLISYVVDETVRRLTKRIEEEDDSLVAAVGKSLNPADIGKHVDVAYVDLAQARDHNEVASHIDTNDIAEQIAVDIDASDVASHIEMYDLAGSIELSDLAEHFDASDIAGYVDEGAIVESMGDISEDVAEHIDYAKLAKNLSPLESLAASQKGTEEVVDPAERVKLDGLASKLLDAAVDKLLLLANKHVEEELAQERAEIEEAKVAACPNGQDDSSSLLATLGAK